jgi:hypothetical protein
MAIFLLPTMFAQGASVSAFLPPLGGSVLMAAVILAMARRPNRPELLTYDLLLGARVLRRTLATLQPAEVLRPEVTSVFETRDGLLVCCEGPRRALFITRALDGYDDVRATIATWRPIEPLRGWAAWRRSVREARRQGMRGAVIGTALESDPSLAAELETLRGLSDPAWRSYRAPSKGMSVRVTVVLWVVLIVMFLAIWQVLQPGTPNP